MPFGFARGGGYGRGGGMGLGFRGSSPPWPYIGRGRGGLPRCSYSVDTPGWQAQTAPYGQQPAAPGYAPYTPQLSSEEELGYLKDQAQAIKEQLEHITARIQDLENKED